MSSGPDTSSAGSTGPGRVARESLRNHYAATLVGIVATLGIAGAASGKPVIAVISILALATATHITARTVKRLMARGVL